MGDHPDWPPTPRALYAGARCLAYLMIAVAGLDVTFGEVTATGGNGRHAFLDIIGLSAAVGGSLGIVGTIFRRWKAEWIATAVTGSALLVYTIIDWYVLVFVVGYPPLPVGILAIGAGILVVTAVATGRKRWRWAALAGSVIVIALAIPLEARNPASVTAMFAFVAGRWVELWLFSDAAVRARRMKPGATPDLDL